VAERRYSENYLLALSNNWQIGATLLCTRRAIAWGGKVETEMGGYL